MEDEPVSVARVGRAVVLIAMSFLAIAAGGVAYLHPTLPSVTTAVAPAAHVPYHVAAVDFVSPDVGWVVAEFETGDYALLHTIDGGVSWTTQLSAPTGGNQQYVKFFDTMAGVFALVGTRPVLNRTTDGGRTWAAIPALSKHSTVLSWSFVDSERGWMLADPGTGSRPRLYSTDDRGWSWRDLGPPVADPEEAFGAQFSFLTTGWLATASRGPYAFKTGDFGVTWTRVRLPIPGWDVGGGGRFFVDVHQTSSSGVIASVVYFPEFLGRGGVSGMIRQFPPLAVPFYDGSRPNDYIYSTMIDQVVGAPNSAMQAPAYELLRSLDNGATWVAIDPPALSGTLGYASKSSWWWVDAGAWSQSADGGLTWTRHPGVDLIAPLPGSLQVLDGDHAWFAGVRTRALETTADAGRHWRLVTLPQALT
jgi:photosystem II stability/assembly factor-like uncharacterized protein